MLKDLNGNGICLFVQFACMVDLSGRTRVSSTKTPNTQRTNVDKLSKSEPARSNHIEQAMEGKKKIKIA